MIASKRVGGKWTVTIWKEEYDRKKDFKVIALNASTSEVRYSKCLSKQDARQQYKDIRTVSDIYLALKK